ncbi:MAG: PLP-dependent aminotransferase family protein [Pseudobutyrivibrio sp.]|nr:PLP-dependent aminotransferase family protein [Pseudobutyrivibrio sp.]
MKVYEKIYSYYIKQMADGSLKPGDKMPSLRESERMLSASRTSIETAYLQLAADGYIYSVEKVGYFVSETVNRYEGVLEETEVETNNKENNLGAARQMEYEYDLATLGEDREVSCLQLWRRYMKSALRQEDRLLSYSANQGEYDLRVEIAAHVRKSRNIICGPEDIVVGAGFQNLLQILIALIPGERTISFPTKDFSDGAMTFKNAGFQVSYRNKNCHVIYVTPSYMTKWGEVMTMKRRHELIDHAKYDGHLIIEDDYQNEFVFSTKPTPSLYAMMGGENIAFLGSFSRVLLPSVRISYIILPRGLRDKYEAIKEYYNQTASKAEQIALAQFLRDGHLGRHIKKMKRLYEEKREIIRDAIEKNITFEHKYILGESGMEIALQINGIDNEKNYALKNIPVRVNLLDSAENSVILLISCSKIPKEDIENSIKKLNEGLQDVFSMINY